MWQHVKTSFASEKAELFHDLVDDLSRSGPSARLSFAVRNRIEGFPLNTRREIVNRRKFNCSPLFLACQKGQPEIVEYLITTCGADIEQEGTYEVLDDRSVHIVTPLWCASVSGHLNVLQILVKHGANVNAVSDSGSTPIRSACFMTHIEVVEFLVKHGAEISKANYNGGTCLINSVQSAKLCLFLLENGADVKAQDNQNKTALHYAIQEHRLQTAKILIRFGADWNAKSKHGDDALQLTCLKGAGDIFEYLIQTVAYPPEKIANAHELMGSTFFDEHNDVSYCLHHWKRALEIRNQHGLLPKQPAKPPLSCYRYQKEFEKQEELIEMDLDRLRIQSLLIVERVLGTQHKDTIFRLMFRGAAFADVLRYQRCADLWRRALELRVQKDPVIYTDTCFCAQALVKHLLDFNNRSVLNRIDNMEQRFQDIVAAFKLLVENSVEVRPLLVIRPQHKKQLDYYSKVIKCITHLIHLMIETAKTDANKVIVKKLVRALIKDNIKCFLSGESLLHLCVSKLNTVTSSYFRDDDPIMVFPNESVVKLMLECGAPVNAKSDNGMTPLHIASFPFNYCPKLLSILLKFDAHLDQPDRKGCTALHILLSNKNDFGQICLLDYMDLRCLCARQIVQSKLTYIGQIPRSLESFVRQHDPEFKPAEKLLVKPRDD